MWIQKLANGGGQCTKMGLPPKQAACHPDRKHAGRGMCKSCYRRWYYEQHQTDLIAYSRTYYRTHAKEQKNACKNRALLRNYGLDSVDYDEMLRRQGYACAICKVSSDAQKLVVDHCHRTKHVRGLLCTRCNLALGTLENRTLVRQAWNYLAPFEQIPHGYLY